MFRYFPGGCSGFKYPELLREVALEAEGCVLFHRDEIMLHGLMCVLLK